MQRVVVTGGSGKAGRAVVTDLTRHGYHVVNVDLEPPQDRSVPHLSVDLTDLGQTHEALAGAQAVVHLAAIPAPRIKPPEVTFRTNVTSTYNVFSSAVSHGVSRVVWASSETVLGLPFDHTPPAYAPIDERHPLYPESSYAMSKVVAEQLAAQFHRWTGIPFAGLRFSNVMEPHDYAAFPAFWEDARTRKWNLWGYVDAHDVAQSVRLALEVDRPGAEVYIVAAADTCMNRPSRDLLHEVFPAVELRGEIGAHETLLSIRKAAAHLGYRPAVSWREYLDG